MSTAWAQLGNPALQGLAESEGLDRRQAEAEIVRRFGPVPDDQSIRALWPALRREWLRRDRRAAKTIAADLRRRRAGKADLPIANHEQRMSYLASCRASKAVVGAVLAYLEPLTDSPASSPHTSDSPKPSPRPNIELGREEVEDQITQGLTDFDDYDVAALAGLLISNITMSLERHDEDRQVRAARSALVAFVTLADHRALTPEYLSRSSIRRIGIPPGIRPTARAIARGANDWAAGQTSKLVTQVLHLFRDTDCDDPIEESLELAFGVLAILAQGSQSDSAIDENDLDRLVHWVLVELVPDTNPPPPHERRTRGSGTSNRLVEYVSRSLLNEPSVDRNSLSWSPTPTGTTELWIDKLHDQRRETVEVISVQTSVTPRQLPPLRQLAAAMSAANVHDGVNAVAIVDGEIRLRCGVGKRRKSPWLHDQALLGVVASAIAGHRLPPELQSLRARDPRGRPVEVSPLIASEAAWEVPPHRARNHLMPDFSALHQDARDFFKGFGKVQRKDRVILVRLPGPNGRLERFIGRRRSDDQLLEISLVTRPPWGAGIKLILHVGLTGERTEHEELAVAVNRREWDLLPSIDIWGGWSGEDSGLRLTSFIPQVMLTPEDEANHELIFAFVTAIVVRGETTATAFGLF